MQKDILKHTFALDFQKAFQDEKSRISTRAPRKKGGAVATFRAKLAKVNPAKKTWKSECLLLTVLPETGAGNLLQNNPIGKKFSLSYHTPPPSRRKDHCNSLLLRSLGRNRGTKTGNRMVLRIPFPGEEGQPAPMAKKVHEITSEGDGGEIASVL